MRPAPLNHSPFNNLKIHHIPAQLRAISFENWGTKPSPLCSQPTFCLAAQLPSAPARVHCCSLTSFPSAPGEALRAWTSQTLPSAFPVPAFLSPFDASCSLQDLSNLVPCTWLHSCLVPRRAPCLPYGDHSKDPAKSHKHRISPLSRQPLFSSQQVNPPWLCLGWQYSRQKVRGCGRCCSSSAACSRDCSTSLKGRVRCSLETTSHKIQPNLLQLLNK